MGRAARVCLVCVLLTGCAHLPPQVQAPKRPSSLPTELAAYYADPGAPRDMTVYPVRDQGRVRELLVRFPLSADGFEPTEPVVEFEWFESTAPGRRPAIVFNPILGGDYPLERGICRFLADHGFHVALVHRKTLKLSPEHDVARLELLLRQAVVRIRQVVDWMASNERVDAERMGSFGISMGGIASVITAAVEPRLKAHVVSLAGGDLPEIIATSNDPLLAKPRAAYLAAQHLDAKTLEARLRETLRTDPIRLAPYVDASRVLMIITLFDRTVGTSNELRLWRALGKPRAAFLPLGHYTAYLSLPYLNRLSLRFFRDRLGS